MERMKIMIEKQNRAHALYYLARYWYDCAETSAAAGFVMNAAFEHRTALKYQKMAEKEYHALLD